jgi:hypothetical protein
MAKLTTLAEWIASSRVYADFDAGEADEFGRGTGQLKPVHDRLFQHAIDLRLARMFTVRGAPPRPPEFMARLTTIVARPKWWPANRGPKNRSDLLGAPLAVFENSWRLVRDAAEAGRHPIEIWESDPALVFEPFPGCFLGRTACVGHEGQVFYFVFGREQQWEDELKRRGMVSVGSGAAGYSRFFRVAGLLGGS